MAISIKDVAKYYAELPYQDKGLDLLQIELSKLGLTADSCPWILEFRKEPEAPVAPPGKSIAAKESIRTEYTGVIDWKQSQCRVSKYFTVRDVTQNDKRRIPVAGSEVERNILRLAKELDEVREAYANPIGVTSWWRPKIVNAQVGGARNSQHLTGGGVDIFPMVGDIWKFQDWLDGRWLDALGKGAKKNFLHLDIRGGGGFDKPGSQGKIRWDY